MSAIGHLTALRDSLVHERRKIAQEWADQGGDALVGAERLQKVQAAIAAVEQALTHEAGLRASLIASCARPALI